MSDVCSSGLPKRRNRVGVCNRAMEDADELSPGTRRRLVAPDLGRCVTVDDIERLLGEVTKAYIDRGYATTGAYVPEQDLSSGRLRIEVVEGRISRIEVDGSGVFVPGAFLYPDGEIGRAHV